MFQTLAFLGSFCDVSTCSSRLLLIELEVLKVFTLFIAYFTLG